MVEKRVTNDPNKKDKIVRINVEVPERLRNSFKGKSATEGKTLKEAIQNLMEDYIKKK